MADRNRKSRKSRTSKQKNQGQFWQHSARLTIWILVLALVVAIFIGSGYGLRKVLFTANPHFRLRQIEILATGRISRHAVRKELKELGVVPMRNLFAFDPARIRHALEERFVVESVAVVRRLPSTLRVTLYERHPVALLKVRDEKLIDNEGWIIPIPQKEPRLILPEITGIYNPEKLKAGTRTHDEVLLAALRFLRLIAVREEGRYYDVTVIQLDYGSNALNVYLNPRGTFRRGAKIVVPIENMEDSLHRLQAIVADRVASGETTSLIDVTYKVNVPVQP